MDYNPGPVPKDAIAYFKDKDLRVGFDYQDVWGQEHAHAFTAAKATKLDILDDLKGALEDHLANGGTFRTFVKDLKPTLADKGWWGVKDQIDPNTGETRQVQLGSVRRLRTIYDANLRSAHAAGQWARGQRRKASHPYYLYVLGPSHHHRDQHVAWAGTLLLKDDAWWQDHFPPNGYGCKCGVREVSKAEHARLVQNGMPTAGEPEINPDTGLPTGRRIRGTVPVQTQAPARHPQTFTNKRTGEQVTVDRGLNPAWAGNPGQDRVRVLRERLAQKTDTVDQRLAQATARQVMNSPILADWLKHPDGELPAGVIDRQAQVALGASSQVVRLSPATFAKQLRSHPDLTAADYALLPDMLAHGILIEQDKQRLVVFAHRPGADRNRWWKMVLKKTTDHQRLYLVSYQKASDRELKRLREKGRVIRSKEGK